MEQQIKITQTSNADMNIGIPKKLTAVEWLHQIFKEREPDKFDWEQAKQMEARQKIDLTEICKCDSTGQTWVCNCCGRPYIENKNN